MNERVIPICFIIATFLSDVSELFGINQIYRSLTDWIIWHILTVAAFIILFLIQIKSEKHKVIKNE